METLTLLLALVVGFIIWYFYYGLECFLNGGSLGRNSYTMHFPLLWEEVMWVLPGGWQRKLEFCRGDSEMARQLPGLFHFIFTHILIPFGPFFVCLYLFHGKNP